MDQKLPPMTLNTTYHHFLANFEPKRDAYGFTVRPQHLQRYRQYAIIYKQEEEERLHKWNCFVIQQAESILTQPSAVENARNVEPVTTEQQAQPVQELTEEGYTSRVGESGTGIHKETDADKVVPAAIIRTKFREVQNWVPVSQSLGHIESMMSSRVQKRKDMRDEQRTISHNNLPSIEEGRHSEGDFEQACEEVCANTMDYSDHGPQEHRASGDGDCAETWFPSREELEFLVQGGVPRDLRGEVWQAFVGVRTRRVEKYYQDLLDPENGSGDDEDHDKSQSGEDIKGPSEIRVGVPEKVRKQIEKVIRCMEPGLYRSVF